LWNADIVGDFCSKNERSRTQEFLIVLASLPVQDFVDTPVTENHFFISQGKSSKTSKKQQQMNIVDFRLLERTKDINLGDVLLVKASWMKACHVIALISPPPH